MDRLISNQMEGIFISSRPCRAIPRLSSRFQPQGFTLVELIGVLAILAILASFITPNVVNQLRTARRDAEDRQLAAIATGIKLFLKQNHAFPANLQALSPDYIPITDAQLTNNPNGFLRYYFVQPNLVGFDNVAGLPPAQLANARFLLITDLSQNANPVITNDAEFEGYWNFDEIGTPDLKIQRGHVGSLFHLLSLSADGIGGSYSIDQGTPIGSSGGTLAPHIQYHISGTNVRLDEQDPFAVAEVQFTITRDAGYQFDPDCATGSQWRVTSSGCYAP